MKRETIFISHATPEDNDFTIWLASRLQLLGYTVWIDKNSLLGGEKIWEEIDNIIRNESVKFLLVYSKNIFQRDQSQEMIPGRLKDGIYKEFSFAETIGKQNRNLIDFMILMNIDGSNYNLFIGADRTTHIPFFENWAVGFEQLVKKLEKDKTPKIEKNLDLGFGTWYEDQLKIKSGIIPRKELYYSNWWPIKKLPESFYIYQFQTEKQANLIYRKENSYPISKISNCLSSFDNEIDMHVTDEIGTVELKPTGKFSITLSDVLLGYDDEKFPSHRDSENHLKQLLKRVFHLMIKYRKMYWHEMSNKKLAYYHTPASLNNLKVNFKYPYRSKKQSKTKNLLGTYQHSSFWHYAVSVKPILTPLIAYSLKNHLTFSDDGFKSWEDKDKIQSHRRSKAKTSKYFNEDWRDFQCAFINSLCNSEGKLEIPLNKSFILTMELWPEMFWADFGYFEPYDKDRQSLLTDFYTETDLIDTSLESDDSLEADETELSDVE